MSDLENLAYNLRPAAGQADGALLLLHGRGTDEFDLVPLIDLLDPAHALVAVTARAPLSLPPGGAHWYMTRQVGFPDGPTFLETLTRLARWLDALSELIGVGLERTVIGGFSQGGVMAYALSLGRGRASPAALLALSGFIPNVDGFELDLASRKGLRIAIGHGTADPIIPVEFGRAAQDLLQRAGLDVVYRESPLGHMVDPTFLEELQPWIRAALD